MSLSESQLQHLDTLKIGDLLKFRREQVHDYPCYKVRRTAHNEQDAVAFFQTAELCEVFQQQAGCPCDKDAAESTRHTSDAGNRGDRLFWKHVGYRGKDVSRPCLVGRGGD